MTKYLFLDIETFSTVDLKKYGVYPYAASPDFEILFCWWTTDGVEYHVAIGPEEIDKIPGLWDPGVTKVAHNAAFERICFSEFLRAIADAVDAPLDGRYLDPDPAVWLDTSAWAATLGLPRSLDKLAKALKVEQKDSAGTRLINTFCKLVRGKRIRPEDKPEQWEEFLAYGRQDVVTLYQVFWALMAEGEWSAAEREIFYVDQIINDRGIAVDVETAALAIAQDVENRTGFEAELRELLEIENAGSVPQITAGLAKKGLVLTDLRAATVEGLLAEASLTTDQRRALELRQEIALVSARKFEAIVNAQVDGRVRGQFYYFGAHTGRWSGRGIQLHNLPRHQAKIPLLVIIDLLLALGASPQDIKGIVRACLFIDGVVVDYSAIEARVLGWVAGEQWVLDAFRAHKDLYVEQAGRMGPQYGRQDGKVATLALGYQGAVNSLRTMGATGTDEELVRVVKAYRRANPKIVKSWYEIEKIFMTGGTFGRIRVTRFGDRRQHRRVTLPSGRSLVYRSVRIVAGEGNHKRIMFTDHRGAPADTYGGRLIENIVQAISREILAAALVRLHKAGFEVVGHVHDEAMVQNTTDVERVSKIMCELPAWAKGLPLDAEGFACSRYRKG